MRPINLLLAVLVLALVASEGYATPIAYGLEFKVGYLGCGSGCASPPLDPRVQLGNSYFGSFIVDDSILAIDGVNRAGSVSQFRIQMEDVVWDSALPDPLSAFKGFRGPGGFGASPGFDVAGGKIVNLRGGVFGFIDVPFVAFSTDVRIAGDPNACGAGSLNCGNAANAFFTNNSLGAFGGSMNVFAISEPATLSLFCMALLAVLVTRVGRRRTAIVAGVRQSRGSAV